MIFIQPSDIPDTPTLIAIGAFLVAAAGGIAQIAQIIHNAKTDERKLPAENKLNESEYARNATETANLATEARLKLEEHTRVLEKRIDDLAERVNLCKVSIENLGRKNRKYLAIIKELLRGIKILIAQVEEANLKPDWVPSKSVEITIESSTEVEKE